MWYYETTARAGTFLLCRTPRRGIAGTPPAVSVVGSSIAMRYTYALQGKPGELAKAISMHISEVKEDAKLNPVPKDAQIAQ